MRTVKVGCAGFSYADWVGTFYPTSLSESEWLSYYAERFDTVELNNTFYRLPTKQMVDAWIRKVRGKKFQYTLKAPQDFTHQEPILSNTEVIEQFKQICLDRLKEQGLLGVVLLQMSPYFQRVDRHVKSTDAMDRLDEALNQIDTKNYGWVIEFRHRSWHDPKTGGHQKDVLELLKKHGVGLVQTDGPGSCKGKELVGNSSYIRFHGRNHDIWYKSKQWEQNKPPEDGRMNRYDYNYTEQELQPWVDWIKEQTGQCNHVYVIFNNHPKARAALNANTVKDKLGMPIKEFGESNTQPEQKTLF